MHRCIELGKAAKGHGETPVGAILVKDNKILAEGIEAVKNHNDITYHAEIEAIRRIIHNYGVTDLSDYTLYTTHEPCIMCAYVIRHHKIGRIVWGISIDETGGHSSAYDILQDKTIKKWGSIPKLIPRVCESECRELHE